VNPAVQPIDDAELHAYVDGQLAPDRVAAVDEALACEPALAARVAAMRSLNADLRDVLDPILAEPIPERLLAAAAPSQAGRGAAARRWTMPALAAAATLVLGLGVGWMARGIAIEGAGTPTTFARQAAFTHALYAADARRPVEVWASEEKSLVTWLTRRLGHPVHAPDLNPLGYALVGGRLVAGNEKPTALLMYENGDKERLTLQVRKDIKHIGARPGGAGDAAFRYAIENGVGVFYWVDEDCGYALSGSLDRTQLLALARVVYGQLAALDAIEHVPARR
jgi:anti-sigma factor RsiW